MEAKRVLIIDDSRFISCLVRNELEARGYEVLSAPTGREGLELVKSENPHLVILDLVLPDRSGESICREIRADKTANGTPIIMLTSKGTDADRVIGRVIGADAYMSKPFEVEALLQNVNRLLTMESHE